MAKAPAARAKASPATAKAAERTAAPKSAKIEAAAHVHQVDAEAACAHDAHDREAPRPSASPLVIERAAALFRALGDSARLSLLARLAHGEYCVTELAERTLRAERLLRRRRVGKHVYYTLADEHVALLIESALAHASE
jgi:ArsR family transcriptional regulator, lead/cadmium/zinc/bismuth-responsive transcriptional repressor